MNEPNIEVDIKSIAHIASGLIYQKIHNGEGYELHPDFKNPGYIDQPIAFFDQELTEKSEETHATCVILKICFEDMAEQPTYLVQAIVIMKLPIRSEMIIEDEDFNIVVLNRIA